MPIYYALQKIFSNSIYLFVIYKLFIELILGDVFLEAASVLFDRKNGRIGFRQSRCSKWSPNFDIQFGSKWKEFQNQRRPLVLKIFNDKRSKLNFFRFENFSKLLKI